MEKQKGLFILLFCVVVPTLDQFTDIRMVFRLMRGPENNFQINSGKIIEAKPQGDDVDNFQRRNFFNI